jgi:hypothetical protein
VFYVVLRALYDDGSSHTWTNVPSFYLAFWPPSCQACPREMAGGPWAMRTRSGRCLVFAMRTASVRPQTIYPVSRAQRAVCKGRVAAHSVS